MALDRLQVENIRCIQVADLSFDARRNLIVGPNASGKTSLLEAIYLLGRARSFRSSRNETLIRSGTEELTAVGFFVAAWIGYAIVVVASPPEGTQLDVEKVLDECRRSLPAWMVPLKIVERGSLPRNPNGKIDRKSLANELQQLFAAAS